MKYKWMCRSLTALFLATLILGIGLTAFAQGSTTATVEGVISDQQNAVVPGVKVTLHNTSTNFERSTTTDSNGFYRVDLLPPGSYELSAEGKNFNLLKRTGVELSVGQRLSLDLQLTVGGGTDIINVSADAPVIESTRSQVSSTVNATSIANLPVNGRNFIDFVLLTPGVTRDVRTGDIAFGGQRGTQNSLQIDGTDNNNTFFGQALGRTGSGRAPYQFSQDAVQEFQVNSSGYSAENGRASGAVINVVTKSGTNEIHGNVFEYYRDRSMNANSPFNKGNQISRGQPNRQPPLHSNQFGGSAGGPIKKDKAFFFFNYDGQRQATPVFIVVGGTPLPASDTKGIAARDALLAQFGQTYSQGFNQDVFLGKVDWQLNSNNRLSVRYNHQSFNGSNLENGGPTSVQEHSGNSNVKTDTINGSLTTVLSPTWINDFRYQYARDREPGTANAKTPEIVINQGGPALNLGQNNFSPRETTENRNQFVDVMSLQMGPHATKFGMDFNIDRIFNFFPGLSGGQYVFNSFDDFADKKPASFTQSFVGAGTQGYTTHPNIFDFGAFFQDDWHVNQRLTINWGVRYDVERLKRPSVTNTDAGLLNLGITNRINNDDNNFGPRFGFAYRPFNSDRAVIRGGYGIFYGRTPAIMLGTATNQNGISVQTISFNAAVAQSTFPNKFDPNNKPSGGTPGLPNIYVFAPGYVQPYTQQGNLGFEFEAARNTSISVNYLMVKGTHLGRTADVNLQNPVPFTVPVFGGGTATFLRYPGRLLPNFARVSEFQSNSNSIYHGFTASVNRRFANNFQFLLSYTLSKAIDDTPDQTSVVVGTDDAKVAQYTLFPALDRSASVVDQRHRFVLSGVWDLNYAGGIENKVAKGILEGWQFSFIYQAASGRPFSRLVSADINNDSNNRTDRAPGFGRNTSYGNGFISFDPRVTKTIGLTERVKVLLIGEAFNSFNNTNISTLNSTFFTATIVGGVPTLLTRNNFFTSPTAASDPRIVQLSVKLQF